MPRVAFLELTLRSSDVCPSTNAVSYEYDTPFLPTQERRRYLDIQRAAAPKNDYRILRADLSKCIGKPQIPYFNLTLHRLSLLETEVGATHPRLGQLVNFARCRMREGAIRG